MVQVSYPGVYIQEVPSSVHTITSVSTSITAFIDFFREGSMNKAVEIFGTSDFERVFGGLDDRSDASYAIRQFFLNGGGSALVVRVASGNPAKATVGIKPTTGAGPALITASAATEGVWGNNLRVEIDSNTTDPNPYFNLTVIRYESEKPDARPLTSERYLNLSVDKSHPKYFESVINHSSKLLLVKHESPADTTTLPAPSGTSSTGDIDITAPPAAGAKIHVTIGSDAIATKVEQTVTLGPKVDNLRDLRAQIENGIRSVPVAGLKSPASWTGATVELVGDKRFRVLSGKGGEEYDPNELVVISNEGGDTTAVNILKFAATAPDSNNAQQYALGSGADATPGVSNGTLQLSATATGYARTAGSFITDGFSIGMDVVASGFSTAANNGASVVTAVTATKLTVTKSPATVVEAVGPRTIDGFNPVAALVRGAIGDDGLKPDANAIIGSKVPPATGMYALDTVDLFNILCIPRAIAADVPEGQRVAIYSAAIAYCSQKRAFLIVDIPEDQDEVQEIKDWVDAHATLRDRNAAIYYPRTKIPDPKNEYRLRSIGASGTMAGIYARTDSERGVWKAPAGIEAVLNGVSELDKKLTDAENGVLNPLGINCLRTFPIYGGIAWGARTLLGADQIGSEWKYVSIRRLALMLEESLSRGTKWVVFEPNDEPLWAKIRLNVGAYMNSLFRQGAFQGTTPKQAYYVKCDGETTIEDDRNKGIVNIEVGFAPLKPAEFVVIKIQQIAGDL